MKKKKLRYRAKRKVFNWERRLEKGRGSEIARVCVKEIKEIKRKRERENQEEKRNEIKEKEKGIF